MTQRSARIELDEDRRFQNRFWIFERIAWAVMAAIVLVALLGFTGQGGPFARARAEGPGGAVDYPRVARWETGDEIEIMLPPVTTGRVTIAIDRQFSKLFQVEDVQPMPSESVATPQGQEMSFDLGDAPGDRTITVHIRAMHPKLVNRLRVRIGDSPELTLTPVVLP